MTTYIDANQIKQALVTSVAAVRVCEICPFDHYCSLGVVAVQCPVHMYSVEGSVSPMQCKSCVQQLQENGIFFWNC